MRWTWRLGDAGRNGCRRVQHSRSRIGRFFWPRRCVKGKREVLKLFADHAAENWMLRSFVGIVKEFLVFIGGVEERRWRPEMFSRVNVNLFLLHWRSSVR